MCTVWVRIPCSMSRWGASPACPQRCAALMTARNPCPGNLTSASSTHLSTHLLRAGDGCKWRAARRGARGGRRGLRKPCFCPLSSPLHEQTLLREPIEQSAPARRSVPITELLPARCCQHPAAAAAPASRQPHGPQVFATPGQPAPAPAQTEEEALGEEAGPWWEAELGGEQAVLAVDLTAPLRYRPAAHYPEVPPGARPPLPGSAVSQGRAGGSEVARTAMRGAGGRPPISLGP
jgi:hypothetical protein